MTEIRFQLLKQIGSGSFSVVYKAIDTESGAPVAIKLVNTQYKKLYESEIRAFRAVNHSNCFPKLISSGQYNTSYAIAMQWLGPSVSEKIKKKGFSLSEIQNLGIQMIKALEILHENHIIHEDIKLENILTDPSDSSKFYLIDFGLSEVYRDSQTKFHYPERTSEVFRGNLLFCSNNVLSGVKASRRDDIISMLLILVFVFKRCLPWSKDCRSIKSMICSRTAGSLDMLLMGCPDEIVMCYKYAISLGFYQKHDYQWIVNTLKNIRIIVGIRKNTQSSRCKRLRNRKRSDARKSLKAFSRKKTNFQCSTIKIMAPEMSEELRSKLKRLQIIDSV